MAVMRLAGASATLAAVRARPPRHPRLPPQKKRESPRQRVGLGGFRAALDRNQSAKGPGRAKPTPVAERRRVNALATQNRANPTGVGGAIGLGQDAQLVLGSERPSPRAIGEFG